MRLRGIYLAETSRDALRRLAWALIMGWRSVSYDTAAACHEAALEKLLTFHNFPAEHARHLRNSNPIESVFATVHLRANAAKRLRTPRSGLYLVLEVMGGAPKRWQRIDKPEALEKVILP